MNEQIQAWLLVTLEKLTSAAERATDFAADQLPLFVQEFLMFTAVYHWIGVIVGVVFIVVAVVCVYKGIQANRRDRYAMDDMVCYAASIFSGIFGLALVAENLKIALLVTFAPRVFLLTEFMRFFK